MGLTRNVAPKVLLIDSRNSRIPADQTFFVTLILELSNQSSWNFPRWVSVRNGYKSAIHFLQYVFSETNHGLILLFTLQKLHRKCALQYHLLWKLKGISCIRFSIFFFLQVENHDDFFTTEEGRVHIQDQRGYYIMYDSALADFK